MKKIILFILLSAVFSAFGSPSVEKMAHSMIMVGFKGYSLENHLNSELKKQLKNGEISGVILYGYNIKNSDQLKKLNESLKSIYPDKLLIAIDQEGGKVMRLKPENGFYGSLSQKETADTKTQKEAYEQYLIMAKELAEHSININFAPSVDLNINKNSPVIGKLGRTFSDNPNIVSSYASSFIKAHRKYGVLTSLKHFPGHGSAKADSHKGFTDVTGTWKTIEMEPYKMLIKEGLADTIMTSHVFNRNLDAELPASLSCNTISILRKDIGYDGIIFTDDIQMRALRDTYELKEIIINSINSGSDIILFSNFFYHDPEFPKKAVNIIKEAVDKGTIKIETLQNSYKRIEKLKSRLK